MLAILSMNWLSQLEEKIRSRVEDAISKILGVPEDADYPPDLKTVLGSLYGVRIMISLLRYRRRITQSIIALSVLAFLSMYLYLALLFSFAYFGIAKVELIRYTWAEALVTAIFIPFAYSDLPKDVWLKALGGIQAAFVVLLGIGTILGYLQRKLDSVYTLGETLESRLEAEEIKTRLDKYAATMMPKPPPPNV